MLFQGVPFEYELLLIYLDLRLLLKLNDSGRGILSVVDAIFGLPIVIHPESNPLFSFINQDISCCPSQYLSFTKENSEADPAILNICYPIAKPQRQLKMVRGGCNSLVLRIVCCSKGGLIGFGKLDLEYLFGVLQSHFGEYLSGLCLLGCQETRILSFTAKR